MRLERAVLVGVLLSGCGDDLRYPFADLTQVSGASPFAACADATHGSELRVSQEVEPSIAVDPHDPAHLVGAWQQDRFADGASRGLVTAASFDGGATWSTSPLRFTRCAGGVFGAVGGYMRASDPWVTISSDGTVFAIGLITDDRTTTTGMLVARSADGGRTWGDPEPLVLESDPDAFNDKDSITADPTIPGRVYATWERITGVTTPTQPIGTGPAMFTRTTGAAPFEAPRAIYDPGVDAQTIGNVIVVLPDGTLVDVFDRFLMASSMSPTVDIDVIRSTDHGDTWSAPVVVAPLDAVGISDPKRGHFVRNGEGLPSIAADPKSGAIYVVWEARFGDRDGIALATSTDAGATWSAPAQVNQRPDVPAFTPVVAVAVDGTVGVTYYDTRDDDLDDLAHYRAAAFLVSSHDHGASWTEERLTGGFDLRPAQVGDVYFLGDYEGLVASGATFVPFFAVAVTSPEDPTDVFVRPITPS